LYASLTYQKIVEASIKNIETQVKQLAKKLGGQQEGRFTTNTRINPKEHCNVLTLEGMEIKSQNSSNMILDKDDCQTENNKENLKKIGGGDENIEKA